MTQADFETQFPAKPLHLQPSKIAREKESFFGKLNESLSEWCSAILVKETRQALKSKQFLYTYALLLIAVGLWVVIGMGWNQWNGRDRLPNGSDLLYGMLVIIAVPLGIVIPFSAYRSLANEFEEGTIHLVSITTMKPWQIVIGKLGSALLQMLVYLSVMAPCMLLAYQLRGVSLPQILWAILFSVWGSFCLTVLGLFLGGLIKGRGFNTFVSVAFVLFLAIINYSWFWIIDEFMRSSIGADDEFGIAMFMLFSHSGAIALLFLTAATTQISFRSDNHATPVRIAMLIHQALFLGSLVAFVMMENSFPNEAICMFMVIGVHYWLIMGFMMVGEQSGISRRIQRSLPTTILGRTSTSLLLPGPGRGFLFALSMIWAVSLTVALIGMFRDDIAAIRGISVNFNLGMGPTAFGLEALYWVVVIAIYPSFYLSLIYLFACWRFRDGRPKAIGFGPFACLVAGAAFVLVTIVCVFLIQSNFRYSQMDEGFRLASVYNWYWNIGNLMAGKSADEFWIPFFLMPSVVVVLICVSKASRELLAKPMAVPQRVLDDQPKSETTALPPGESIEDIFSDVSSRPAQ